MFGFKKKETQKDEAQLFLESVQDAPEMPDPDEKTDEELEKIARADSTAHYDILNLLVLAVIVIFFGAVFLALTNHQDFTNENKLTKESFISGNYLAKLEKTFEASIPLQDRLHNAASRIEYCFGIGNDTDLIDIQSKKSADDPYSIETDTDSNSPITDSQADDYKETDEVAEETEPPQNEDEDDAGGNKKIETIKLPTTSSTTSSESETETTTTVNTASPGATTTTTVPPTTTVTTTTTTPTETTTLTTTTPAETSATDTETTTEQPPEETTAEEEE
jgi:hypothetical protein